MKDFGFPEATVKTIINEIRISNNKILSAVEEEIEKLQKYTGGSSVEPKDIRVKLNDILKIISDAKKDD